MVGRAITGLAAGSWVVMVVAFSSLFPPAEAVRATAILTLVNSICRMLATGVNGPLIDLGGYALAFNLAALVGLGAVLVYLPVPEAPFERKKPSLVGTRKLLTRRDVLLPSLLNALVQYVSWATVFGFLPVLAKSLGASDTTLGLMVSLNIGVGVLGNLAASLLAHKMSLRILLFLSFVLMAGGLILAALASSLAWIFAAQFLIGLGGGAAYPTLMGMSIEHVDQPQRSSAMGLHQAVYGIGMFAGPWLSGILADRMGLPAMFAVTGLASLALGSLGIWALPRSKDKPAQAER
jgi:predicted MFS family arabinose efflux permease